MNLKPSKFGKLLMPMFALFNVVNVIFLFWAEKLASLNIDYIIVIIGNALVFILTMLTLWLHVSASKKSNPNVLVRSVMGSTFIKMIIIGSAVIAYVMWAKEKRSNLAVIVTMALYLVYTFLEVKTVLGLQKKNANNVSN